MAASSPATNYIGVFWDIENCQIPRGKSPLLICKKIRDLKFFKGYKEIQESRLPIINFKKILCIYIKHIYLFDFWLFWTVRGELPYTTLDQLE